MITATVLELGAPNKNGRTYTTEVGEQIANQINERLRDGVVWGQLEGQDDPSCALDLSKVSHTIEAVRVEGNMLVADIKILHTPPGDIARALMAQPASFGFRPRGTGVVNAAGTITDYRIISIDLVKDPA